MQNVNPKVTPIPRHRPSTSLGTNGLGAPRILAQAELGERGFHQCACPRRFDRAAEAFLYQRHDAAHVLHAARAGFGDDLEDLRFGFGLPKLLRQEAFDDGDLAFLDRGAVFAAVLAVDVGALRGAA